MSIVRAIERVEWTYPGYSLLGGDSIVINYWFLQYYQLCYK